MTCEHATQLLHLDRPGERSESEEQQLQAHLRTCESCRSEAGIISRSAAGMDALLRSGVPTPHVAKETEKILRAIGSSVAPFDLVGWILGLAARRGATTAYAAVSLTLLVVLGLQLSGSGYTSAPPAVRTGPYLAYRVDTRQLDRLASLPIPGGLKISLTGRSVLEIRKDQLEQTTRMAGQAMLHSLALTSEERRNIESIIGSLIRSSEPEIRLGTIGG